MAPCRKLFYGGKYFLFLFTWEENRGKETLRNSPKVFFEFLSRLFSTSFLKEKRIEGWIVFPDAELLLYQERCLFLTQRRELEPDYVALCDEHFTKEYQRFDDGNTALEQFLIDGKPLIKLVNELEDVEPY